MRSSERTTAMALYEDVDRQHRAPAISYDPAHRMGASAPAIRMEQLFAAARVALLALLVVCWIAGAYAGIVYWSFQGSLLGVIASAIVPGLAATATWSAFMAMQEPHQRRDP